MPLHLATEGQKVVLKDIASGAKLKKKLLGMGLTPGIEFSVVNKTTTGPLLINIRGTRLALGRGVASKIVVDAI